MYYACVTSVRSDVVICITLAAHTFNYSARITVEASRGAARTVVADRRDAAGSGYKSVAPKRVSGSG